SMKSASAIAAAPMRRARRSASRTQSTPFTASSVTRCCRVSGAAMLKTAKLFCCAVFLAFLCAAMPDMADAGAPPAEQAQLLKQFQSSHDRVRARLSPDDRKTLDQVCQRLAKMLHRPAKLPQDAAAMLARAMPSLSSGEIQSLADY